MKVLVELSEMEVVLVVKVIVDIEVVEVEATKRQFFVAKITSIKIYFGLVKGSVTGEHNK